MATNITISTGGSTKIVTVSQAQNNITISGVGNSYVHPNHTGEVTSTADGAQIITDDVVDEANLKVSNTPTDGYVLTAQSGNNGGLTWASPGTSSVGNGSITTDKIADDAVTADKLADSINSSITANTNKVDLTADGAGTIHVNNLPTVPVSKGGTNATSFADKAVIITQGSGVDTLAAAAMTTDGSLLIGGGSGPAVATLTAGTNVTITNADGAITIAAASGSGNGDIEGVTAGTGLSGGGESGSVSLNVEAAQTAITSVVNSSLEIGRDADNRIKFGTDDQIIFEVGGGDNVIMKASGEIEATKFDGALEGNADTATALATARNIGGVSFDGTGNINLPGVNAAGNQNTSGTAATVTGAAQSNITSLGTLTTLSVDNITVDSNTISSTDSNGNILLAANGTGFVELRGNQDGSADNPGAIRFNCAANTHGITIKSPAHSAEAIYTLTLPEDDGTDGQVLKTDGSGVLDWVDQVADTEVVQDIAGALVATGGTKTNISVTYDDANNNMDFVVASDLNTTGNAGTATALATARTIGGVSFDGSANISLPGVNAAGNQNTSGTAAVATSVTVADESGDTSCNVLFTTGATGDLGPKSGTNLTFNSSTGVLSATSFNGDITGNVRGSEASFLGQSSSVDAAGEAEGTIIKFGDDATTAGKVYTFSSGTWVEVDANYEAKTKGLLGMALGNNSTSFGMLIYGVGYLSHNPGSAGDILYISHSATGQISSTSPTDAGDFHRVVGHCLADNKVFFSPSQDYIDLG